MSQKVTKVEDGEEYTDWNDIIQASDIAKDGETVVLGASTIRGGEKSMIVLMTAEIIR